MKPVEKRESMERLIKYSKREERESLAGVIEYYLSTLGQSHAERVTAHYLKMILRTIGCPHQAIEKRPREVYDTDMKKGISLREQDLRSKLAALSEQHDRVVADRNKLEVQLENLQFLFDKLASKKTKDILEVIHRRKIKDTSNTV